MCGASERLLVQIQRLVAYGRQGLAQRLERSLAPLAHGLESGAMQQKLEAAIRAELERQANRDPNDALWYERERWFGKDGRDIVDGWLDVPALAQAILTTLIGHHADLHTADCRCAVYDLLTVDISGGG